MRTTIGQNRAALDLSTALASSALLALVVIYSWLGVIGLKWLSVLPMHLHGDFRF